MIVTEDFITREDGVKLVRTYSDEGLYIERDGVLYEEAIDPKSKRRKYTESAEKIQPIGGYYYGKIQTENDSTGNQ